MKRTELNTMAKTVFSRCRALMQKKNRDYAGANDALRNFKIADAVGLDSVVGVLYRLQDKLSRLVTLTLEARDPAVAAESIEDTAYDLINYTVLFLACRHDKIKLEQRMAKKPPSIIWSGPVSIRLPRFFNISVTTAADAHTTELTDD